jgi:putative flippase GtrA
MTASLPERLRFLVYLGGGVLSAVVDIGTLQALLTMGVPTLAATTAAFLAGLVVNYAWHVRVTFNQPHRTANFVRYLFVVAVNYAATVGLVLAFDHLFGSPLAGKLVALPAVAAIGYLLGKHWIFR